MKTIYDHLKRGPVLVGEVRGFQSEVGKKFDKSDKNAPPITFGVFKIHLELLGDGAPVMVTIYPGQSDNTEALSERLGLKRGSPVALIVSKSEYKDGQRKVVCALDSIWPLDPEEEKRIRPA